MAKIKLMTNNQGLGFAKLGRDKGVHCSAFEDAQKDGRVDDFLKGLMPQILWQNGSHRVVKNDNETISALIDCGKIDWEQTNQAAIDSTGRTQYTDSEVVSEMPRGEKLVGLVEVIFRNYGCHFSDVDVDKKMVEYGESMISPFFQTKINEIFPEFADKHPNGNHWKDKKDKWCYVAFRRWRDGRRVDVYRYGRDWNVDWWFGGVRKPQSLALGH